MWFGPLSSAYKLLRANTHECDHDELSAKHPSACSRRNLAPSSTPESGAYVQDTVKELEALRSKYGSLLTTAKSHEEMAGRAAREGQLRAEEVKRNGVLSGKDYSSETPTRAKGMLTTALFCLFSFMSFPVAGGWNSAIYEHSKRKV